MPEVSIVLPTYNRADTIQRAVGSVLRQGFEDWELIVVDDGSTDGTADLLRDTDPRLRVLRQENAGCYAARNRGIQESRGGLITFLDSDDEWLPHYLGITTAFLRAFPEESCVMTEFIEQAGPHEHIRHDHDEIASRFPRMARLVGSSMLDLPPGETDDYLRVYDRREPLGPWGRALAAEAGYPEAALYRGHIFEHMRWGHLGWLPITMVRREVLETVGSFPESYRTAADYRFLGLLFRHYQANMISLPGAIKHDRGEAGVELAEGHLATGQHGYRYALKRLPLFDELFVEGREADPEIRRVRGLYLLYAGHVALQHGRRREALDHLGEAREALPRSGQARWLWRLARLSPGDEAARVAYRGLLRIGDVAARVASGEITAGDVVRKLRGTTGTRHRSGESR